MHKSSTELTPFKYECPFCHRFKKLMVRNHEMIGCQLCINKRKNKLPFRV